MLLPEHGAAALAEACGAEVEYMEGSAPVCHGPALQSLDDMDQLVVPDPHTTHPLKENLKASQMVANEIGDKAFIIGRTDRWPFSPSAMLLGMEEFLLCLTQADGGRGGGGRSEAGEEVAPLVRICARSHDALRPAQSRRTMTSIGESLCR